MTFPNFARFFQLCHDHSPYRWQTRLAAQVLADKQWPCALDLPTGSGKTSAIDIALYALAFAAHQGQRGLFPRRIVFVVDRRVLVDQAYRHGERLLHRIATAAELSSVRRALSELCPDEPPRSLRLRGACPTDPRWCRSPDQIQIVASTVDQIGSRLLLRGYGVSPRMRSVEAGLVGQDTIMFLDEAHLSGPFLDTLGDLQSLDPVRSIAPRRQVVPMSATLVPTDAIGNAFRLEDEDFRDETLARRLVASKTVRWTEDKLERVLGAIDAPCVLLVANTVRTALEWFYAAGGGESDCSGGPVRRETRLVTGRMRQPDRQIVLDAVEARLEKREPTLVVATQCVEAGVDWDFDALVSECASWDALVQRLGRVNRRGERSDALCFILPAQRTYSDRDTGKNSCPVYGEHERHTADWLVEVSPLQCAPGAMPEPPDACVSPPTPAPALIPEYLDLWSQNRADGPAFDVSVFLHGAYQENDVQVVWRDLDLDRDRPYLGLLLKALPPSSLEAVSVPLRELRSWLRERPVILMCADVRVQSASDVRVGDTIVVPTTYGGIGEHGTFDPTADLVSDVSPTALRDHRDIQFQVHDAPPVRDDEPVADQVRAWLREEQSRAPLQAWTWLDLGPRWLFVSNLPIDDDDDGPTFRRREVLLESHLNGVATRTRTVAERLGLPPPMAADLEMAARLHDLGKLDDRFQRLCGRTPETGPLGKSGDDWIARRRRESVTDYPSGERHEALSTELMIRHGLHDRANDKELVEHLVASHHGWARPFIRSAQGTAHVRDRLFDVEFDSAVTHEEAERAPPRFRSVQRRFGWLGLCWLEAIVQLCDHRQSEAEQRGKIASPGGEHLFLGHPEGPQVAPPSEVILNALNGLVPGDFLAAIGVLRALELAGSPARLRWQGTQPHIATDLEIDEVVSNLVHVRSGFSGIWPSELNKLTADQCEQLLRASIDPFRSLVVAMISAGGRSDMDFVSGGRGGFKGIFEWSTNPRTRGFAADSLRSTLVGPRSLIKGAKSFRWSPLAAQGARRPQSATNDKRAEPWIEWLSLLGISSLVSVPEVRRGRIFTRSTGVHGFRWDAKELRWPLWRTALTWYDVAAALAATTSSLHDALWCEAPRLVFGTARNRSYGLGPGRPIGP